MSDSPNIIQKSYVITTVKCKCATVINAFNQKTVYWCFVKIAKQNRSPVIDGEVVSYRPRYWIFSQFLGHDPKLNRKIQSLSINFICIWYKWHNGVGLSDHY